MSPHYLLLTLSLFLKLGVFSFPVQKFFLDCSYSCRTWLYDLLQMGLSSLVNLFFSQGWLWEWSLPTVNWLTARCLSALPWYCWTKFCLTWCSVGLGWPDKYRPRNLQAWSFGLWNESVIYLSSLAPNAVPIRFMSFNQFRNLCSPSPEKSDLLFV